MIHVTYVTADTSPVADCTCGHPYSLHSTSTTRFCGLATCTCREFVAAESKLSHTTRCYLCDSKEHPTKFCPNVKGRRAGG